MKKIILSILVIFTLIGLSYFHYQKNNKVKESISGAYNALNFLAQARTYPFDKIPAEAHFAAWEKMKEKNQTIAQRRNDNWETLGPHNFAGRMLTLAFNPQNPNTLYAGSASGGLWRSYSAGLGENAWEQVPIEWPVLGVSTIAFAPNDSMTIYIGTGEVYNFEAAGTGAAYRNTRGSYGMGILKSTDGGVTWTRSLDWSYNQERGIWAVRVDPNDANLVYAATTEGTFKSTDAGETWRSVLDVVMANDLLINQSNSNELIVGCGNLGSPGFGIYRSTDAGESWTQVSDSDIPDDFLGKIQLGASPSEPNIVYASIGNGFGFDDGSTRLIRSDDFGVTWELQNTEDYSLWQGWFAHDVAVHPERSEEITAIGIGVWKSTDSGVTLEEASSTGLGFSNPTIAGPDGADSYVHSDAHDVIYQPGTNFIFVANDGGVHVSEDDGNTWRSRNARLQTTQFYNGFSNSHQDSVFMVGGLQDNGTIAYNGDLTWRRISGGDGSWTAINPNDDRFVFTSSQFLNINAFSPNGNFRPDLQDSDPIAFIAPYVIAADGETMYAGSSNISVSFNGGRDWAAGFSTPGNPVLSMEVSTQKPEKLYFATAPSVLGRGRVYVFDDIFAFDAVEITQDLPDRFPMDMTVDPTNDEIAYITFSGFGTGHVFKTTNSGASWTDISTDLPDVPTNAVVVDPLIPDHIYVGNDLGVFFSPDGGNSWEPWQEGMMEAVMIFDLKISPSNRKLRAATHGNGGFERNLVEETSSVAEISSLSNTVLFPNPIQTTATLKYELTEKTNLDIRIFDISGKEMSTVFNGTSTEGLNQVEVDASKLTTGFYFVKMSGDSGVFSTKFQKI